MFLFLNLSTVRVDFNGDIFCWKELPGNYCGTAAPLVVKDWLENIDSIIILIKHIKGIDNRVN